MELILILHSVMEGMQCIGAVFGGGGAIYLGKSNLTYNGIMSVSFINSDANGMGGAIFGSRSNITLRGDMSVMFTNNIAVRDGGAIYLGGSNIILDVNNYVGNV